MTDISDIIRQAQAALAQPDNPAHRRGLAVVLADAASDPMVSEGQRLEAAALAVYLSAGRLGRRDAN
jgi:hypothetical protein